MLWWLAQNTITATILALAVLLICRLCPLRPSIRHGLWLLVLLKLVAPPLVEWPWNPLEATGLMKPEPAVVTIELSQLQVINLVNFETSNRPDGVHGLVLPANLQPPEEAAPTHVPTFWERYSFLQPWAIGAWLTGPSACWPSIHPRGRFRRLMRGGGLLPESCAAKFGGSPAR